MSKFVFLGPGPRWAFAPGKSVEAGKEVELSDEEAARVQAHGISLAKATEEEVREITSPSAPLAPPVAPADGPVHPEDGTASVGADGTPAVDPLDPPAAPAAPSGGKSKTPAK